MAKKIEIEFISRGFRDILMSNSMESLVRSAASEIADRAGDGFEASTFRGNYGGGRWVGAVTATTYEAMLAEAEEDSLTKAVG